MCPRGQSSTVSGRKRGVDVVESGGLTCSSPRKSAAMVLQLKSGGWFGILVACLQAAQSLRLCCHGIKVIAQVQHAVLCDILQQLRLRQLLCNTLQRDIDHVANCPCPHGVFLARVLLAAEPRRLLGLVADSSSRSMVYSRVHSRLLLVAHLMPFGRHFVLTLLQLADGHAGEAELPSYRRLQTHAGDKDESECTC